MALNGQTKEKPWLDPKRRRTTGNLKTLSNGSGELPTDGTTSLPVTPGSPPITPRPVSQSGTSTSSNPDFPDGNLFYAYARRSNDLKSRWLLTFASASIANEWWQLLELHFHGATRPGPQLFNFQDPETLTKAWKHPRFDHLKSKWMFISFSDTPTNGLGRVTQGIIPVQDVDGNIMGRGASVGREGDEQTRDVPRLEEYFERMVEAVENNTAQVAALAASQRKNSATDKGKSGSADGYFGAPTNGNSDPLSRVADLLAKNAEQVEALTRKQVEHDQQLKAIQESSSREPQQGGGFDMDKLSSHLDRIHLALMEQNDPDRRDSGHTAKDQRATLTQVDFSPLTDRLEKVQEAMEQNSALIKALLDEGTGESSKPTTPFWGRETPAVDLTPLQNHLEKIHVAIEQQSAHMQALVGFATGTDEEGDAPVLPSPGPRMSENLAPLGEHLEQIYEAIADGNKHARETTVDFTPLGEKLDEVNEHLQCLREWTEFDSEQLTQLIDVQKTTQESSIKHEPAVTGHLASMRSAMDQNTEHMKSLLDTKLAPASPTADINFTPLTDRLNRIHQSLERQYKDQPSGTGDARFLLSALTSHLSKIQGVTEQNANLVKHLREKQNTNQERMQNALTETAGQVHLLASRQFEHENLVASSKITTAQQQRFEQRLEATSSQVRELMSGHREMLEVMRELARSLSSGSEKCEHIVIPPPRKMSRKVVGFVYDAKDGPI